jgi:hypothetical protein
MLPLKNMPDVGIVTKAIEIRYKIIITSITFSHSRFEHVGVLIMMMNDNLISMVL